MLESSSSPVFVPSFWADRKQREQLTPAPVIQLPDEEAGLSPAVCVNGHSSGAQEQALISAPMGIGFPLAPGKEENRGVPAGGPEKRMIGAPLCNSIAQSR